MLLTVARMRAFAADDAVAFAGKRGYIKSSPTPKTKEMSFMRFGKVLFSLTAVLASALCHESFGAGGRFFLVEQRTQVPVMCCTMPSGWTVGGKTEWTQDMANPINWYVWAQRPDRRAKIIIATPAVIGSPGAIRQVRMLQDPRVLAQMLQEPLKKDHFFTELSLTDAKFGDFQVDPQLIRKRQQQAAERGIRLTNLVPAELIIRYDGYCGSEKRVLYASLPMLIAESQATAMSRTTTIELLMPMSFSCPPEEVEATKSTLTGIVQALQINPKFIQLVNYIVSRRVEKRLEVMNHIRNTQMEVARSKSETQDRVRDMWSEYIRDVDSVSNPNTGEQMFVDNRYNHAWINSNDEIIYQDSGSFNPNEDQNYNRTNWKQLK